MRLVPHGNWYTAGFGAKRAWLYALALAIAAFFAIAPASASLFEVDGVTVSLSAADAVQAKKQAISEATGQALTAVLQRLTRREDHDRLPEPDLAAVENMLSGIRVVQENAAGTHYSATFNFRFEPEAVRILLGHSGISFVERVAEPVLVVPVLRVGETLAPGGDDAYLAAWQTLDTTNALTPVRLPTAPIQDQGVSREAVLAGDPDALQSLRYLYESRFVLVSVCASPDEKSPLVCTLQGDGPYGPVDASETVSGTDDLAAALQLAAQSLLLSMEDAWKAASVTGPPAGQDSVPGDIQELPVSVTFSSLREWQELRSQLAIVPGVSTVDVIALHAKGAQLNVQFAGSIDQFAQMLSAQNLELVSDGEHWTLRAF